MANIQKTSSQQNTYSNVQTPTVNNSVLSGVRSQILAIQPRALVHGDCLGEINNVSIHPKSVFHLDAKGKTLKIVNSEIHPRAQVYAGSDIDDARVYGTMRGGLIKNTTLRDSGEMHAGLATDADIYGHMYGGYIHKSTICKDGIVSQGESYNNQNIGIKVPLHRKVKDWARIGEYAFFNATKIGKGKQAESLPAYNDSPAYTEFAAEPSSSNEKGQAQTKADARLSLESTSKEDLPPYTQIHGESSQQATNTNIKAEKNPFDQM